MITHMSSNNFIVKMLIALLLFLQAQCWGGNAGVARPISKANNNFNIVGGKTISITDAPYQVSIFFRARGGCTGVLIAADIVVSAGYCVSENNPSDFKVRAGSDFIDEGGEYVEVRKGLVHPEFRRYDYYDYNIGISWLSKKLPLSDKIGTIEMLNQGEEIEDGESVFVSGWGTESDDGDNAVYLQRAEVYTSNFTICTDLYREARITLTPRSMCTLKEGSGFCRGEWGAPLIYKGKLAGIATTYINKCGGAKYPQMSAKVSSMRDWIDEALKNNTIYN